MKEILIPFLFDQSHRFEKAVQNIAKTELGPFIDINITGGKKII